MKKPDIVDEHLYEIVGGTSRVLRPDLLDKAGRNALAHAARSFVKQNTASTRFALVHTHPEKPSETLLH